MPTLQELIAQALQGKAAPTPAPRPDRIYSTEEFPGLKRYFDTGEQPGAPKEPQIGAAPMRDRIRAAVMNSGILQQPLGRLAMGTDMIERAWTDPIAATEINSGTAPPGVGNLAATLRPGSTAGQYRVIEPILERLRYFYKLGGNAPRKASWESILSPDALPAFGQDEQLARDFAGIWGATSPNTDVVRNTQEALSAFISTLLSGGRRQLTVAEARALEPVALTMAGAKAPNVNRVILNQPLSGDKVQAMSEFMQGRERIPMDVHFLYGAGSPNTELQREIPELRRLMTQAEGRRLSKTDLYKRTENAYMNALRQVSDRQQHPNAAYGQLWEGFRADKGLPFQGGPIDLLREQELLDSGRMLDAAYVKQKLTQWAARRKAKK